MPRLLVASFILTSSLLVAAVPAAAQQPRFFAGASSIADDDRTNSALSEGPARAWAVTAGMHLTPHVSIRMTVDTPRRRHRLSEGTYVRAPHDLPVAETLTSTRSSVSYSVIVAGHVSRKRRVRISVLAGIAEVVHEYSALIRQVELRPDGDAVLPDLHDRSRYVWPGGVVGLEVPLRVAARLEVVPEFRAIGFLLSDSPDPWILRSGIGLRWRF